MVSAHHSEIAILGLPPAATSAFPHRGLSNYNQKDVQIKSWCQFSSVLTWWYLHWSLHLLLISVISWFWLQNTGQNIVFMCTDDIGTHLNLLWPVLRVFWWSEFGLFWHVLTFLISFAGDPPFSSLPILLYSKTCLLHHTWALFNHCSVCSIDSTVLMWMCWVFREFLTIPGISLYFSLNCFYSSISLSIIFYTSFFSFLSFLSIFWLPSTQKREDRSEEKMTIKKEDR